MGILKYLSNKTRIELIVHKCQLKMEKNIFLETILLTLNVWLESVPHLTPKLSCPVTFFQW